MELKIVNLNGGNVEVSNLNNINLFILKIEFKKNIICYFFPIDVMIASKREFLILFIFLINIEWIKASHTNMNLYNKEKKLIVFWDFFDVLVATQASFQKTLMTS